MATWTMIYAFWFCTLASVATFGVGLCYDLGPVKSLSWALFLLAFVLSERILDNDR